MKLEEMKKIGEGRIKARWHIGHISQIHEDAADIDSEDGAIADNIYGSGNQNFIVMAANSWDKLMAVVEAAKSERRDHDADREDWKCTCDLCLTLEALEKD